MEVEISPFADIGRGLAGVGLGDLECVLEQAALGDPEAGVLDVQLGPEREAPQHQRVFVSRSTNAVIGWK